MRGEPTPGETTLPAEMETPTTVTQRDERDPGGTRSLAAMRTSDVGIGDGDYPGVPRAPGLAAVDAVIADGLRSLLSGVEPVRGPDGSFTARVGGSLVLVRGLHFNLPLVQALVPIARGMASTPALLEALNELNANMLFGRLFWTGGAVIVAVEVPAVEIRADQVTLACIQAGSLATRLRTELRDRPGDHLAVDVSASDSEPSCMD